MLNIFRDAQGMLFGSPHMEEQRLFLNLVILHVFVGAVLQ